MIDFIYLHAIFNTSLKFARVLEIGRKRYYQSFENTARISLRPFHPITQTYAREREQHPVST